MRIKSLLVLAVTTLGLVGTMTVPADAAFIRICPTTDHVVFGAPGLQLSTGLPTVTVDSFYSELAPGCRQINDNGTVTEADVAGHTTGFATGNCVLALLSGPFFTGVLVGGSVWVAVDQGVGFTVAVGVKALVPNVICSETAADGFGVGVIIG